LKFFAQRILNKNAYEDDKVDELYIIIKNNYPESYSAVEKIREFIKSKYKYTLNNEEELYLTIHIEKVVNKK
ncbi:MAG TPA: PRD domain-containing protein, partial [Gallicola sp.]|nr:PRD domain-containing protein [Gallicola sp.]